MQPSQIKDNNIQNKNKNNNSNDNNETFIYARSRMSIFPCYKIILASKPVSFFRLIDVCRGFFMTYQIPHKRDVTKNMVEQRDKYYQSRGRKRKLLSGHVSNESLEFD